MTRAPIRRVLLAFLLCVPLTARAEVPEGGAFAPLVERINSGLSKDDVPITATFTGSEILVFGAIERNRFFEVGTDILPDIVVAISGPVRPVMVRRKSRVAGVWTNTDSVLIASAPAFYAVASTRPIPEILNSFERKVARVALEDTVYFAGTPFSSDDPQTFRHALLRLRRENGLYGTDSGGVELLGTTLFKSRFALPVNIVEGHYQVRVLLVRGGHVIDERSSEIFVHKGVFGEFVNRASREQPLGFGLAAVLIALLFGWAASEAFRRLRR